MAAEYQVNIKLNTQQFKTELGKLQNVVKDAGTINLAPTKQQASALKLQSKEIKEQAKQAKTLLQLESQKNANDRQRQRLWHASDVLEQKAVKTTKIRKTIGERATALQKKDLLLAKQRGHEAEKLVRNAQHNLRLERLKTAEIRKQQNQGLGLRRLGDRAGRISRRAGPQLALPSSQLIQEQRSAEFTARANERTANAYARSADRGKEILAASQASAKAAEQHYRWVEKRGAVGAPSSPLNVVGGRVRPGRQGWLSRMQQQNPGRFQLGDAGQGAMISGAFPLLFGQGPGVAAAGALGGGLGGFLGGQGGAFAGGLVATAVASQIGAAVDSLRNLGDALKKPTAALQQMEQMGLKVDEGLKRQINSLIEFGKAGEAQILANKQLANIIGTQGVKGLMDMDTAFDDLADKSARLFLILSSELAPALKGIVKLTTNFVSALLGPDIQRRAMNIDPGAYNKAKGEAASQSKARLFGVGIPFMGNEKLYDKILTKLSADIVKNNQEATLSNITTKQFDEPGKNPIKNLQKQRELLENNFRLNEKQFKIEQDIAKLKERGWTGDEEAYRKEAQLVEQLQAQRQLYLEIAQTIKQGIVNSIEAAITGARSLGDVLRSITQSVGRSFLNAAINAGVGALTSSWGNTGNMSSQGYFNSNTGKGIAGPNYGLAEGGYVSGPTDALIGEGGEGEYVIPESKMGDALAKYAGGARGDDVLAGGGGDVAAGGTGGAGGGSIDVRFTSERINDVSYVTFEQFQAGVQQAASEGAKRGEMSTLRRLQSSPSTRNKVGIR